MSLNATTSEYQFTPMQSNMLSAPVVGQYFAEQDMVYSKDNSSTKAQFGLSSHDQQSYDAANYYMFNPTMELGVDCGRTNEAAGRPNLNGVSNSGGGACYPMSAAAQNASMQLDANFNSFGPSAEQVILAEGDIRYAPARFVDQNNYVSPAMSDFTYQPRLMGTRDGAASGCSSTGIDQTIGNSSMCALQDDPLPYFSSSDPRTVYGVDEPHSSYWSSLEGGGMVSQGCSQLSDNYMLDTSACNLESVETGMPPRIPPQYGNAMSDNGQNPAPNMQAALHQRKMQAPYHAQQHPRNSLAKPPASAHAQAQHHAQARSQHQAPARSQHQAPARAHHAQAQAQGQRSGSPAKYPSHAEAMKKGQVNGHGPASAARGNAGVRMEPQYFRQVIRS